MHPRTLIFALPLLAFTGCLNRASSLGKGPVQPNPEPVLAHDVTVRVNQLGKMIDHFDDSASPLPTNSDADLRKTMSAVFADLSQILPTLHGPNENGAFRQQRRIVDHTRQQLQNMSDNLSPDPVIDSGLRAAYNALANLQRDQFYDRKDVARSLDTYRAKLNALDEERGPLHRDAVTQAVRSLSQLLHQMSDTLATRLQQQPKQASQTEAPSNRSSRRRI